MNSDHNAAVRVKNFGTHLEELKLHHYPFWRAKYLLNRALEMRPLFGASFSRPMVEIGCGDGSVTKLFFADKIDFGVEQHPRSDSYCGSFGEVKIINPETNTLPFPPNSISSMFSLSVLEHVTNLNALLREAYGVLQSGGQFVSNVNTDKLKKPPFSFQVEECPNLLSPDQWVDRFRDCGFEVERVVPTLPEWVERTTRTLEHIRGLRYNMTNRILLRDLWKELYVEACRSGSIHTDLAVTIFAVKP